MDEKLVNHVQGFCTFVYCRDGALWYRTETNVIFPVPVVDMGTATFQATEKGVLLMRWIRKYLDEINATR